MCVCVCVCVCVHSFVNGYLDCHPILASVNTAAMNIEVQIYLQHSGFICFEYTPRNEIAGSYGSLFVIVARI